MKCRRVLNRNTLLAVLGSEQWHIAACDPADTPEQFELAALSGPLCGSIFYEFNTQLVDCPCELAPRCPFRQFNPCLSG